MLLLIGLVPAGPRPPRPVAGVGTRRRRGHLPLRDPSACTARSRRRAQRQRFAVSASRQTCHGSSNTTPSGERFLGRASPGWYGSGRDGTRHSSTSVPSPPVAPRSTRPAPVVPSSARCARCAGRGLDPGGVGRDFVAAPGRWGRRDRRCPAPSRGSARVAWRHRARRRARWRSPTASRRFERPPWRMRLLAHRQAGGPARFSPRPRHDRGASPANHRGSGDDPLALSPCVRGASREAPLAVLARLCNRCGASPVRPSRTTARRRWRSTRRKPGDAEPRPLLARHRTWKVAGTQTPRGRPPLR